MAGFALPDKEFLVVFNEDQEMANFLHKGPGSKYFDFGELFGFCNN